MKSALLYTAVIAIFTLVVTLGIEAGYSHGYELATWISPHEMGDSPLPSSD